MRSTSSELKLLELEYLLGLDEKASSKVVDGRRGQELPRSCKAEMEVTVHFRLQGPLPSSETRREFQKLMSSLARIVDTTSGRTERGEPDFASINDALLAGSLSVGTHGMAVPEHRVAASASRDRPGWCADDNSGQPLKPARCVTCWAGCGGLPGHVVGFVRCELTFLAIKAFRNRNRGMALGDAGDVLDRWRRRWGELWG